MTIEELVDATVMEHLSLYGDISRMDPFAIHMVKHSQHPLMRFRRTWMRATALRQLQESTARQEKNNEALASVPRVKGKSIQQEASLDPFMAADMRRRHKTTWNDPDFLGFVRREEPGIFPKRDE